MDIDKLHEQLGLMAEQVKRVIQWSMEKNGFNDKPYANKNTLIDSHIYDDLNVSAADVDLIEVLIHDYMDYIESGMTTGHWVDEQYLLPWMQDKGIDTSNDVLYKIQYSIWKWGISPRPFFDEAWDIIDDYWDDWADEIIKILLEDFEDIEGFEVKKEG